MRQVASRVKLTKELCRLAMFGPRVSGRRLGAFEGVTLERCHPISEVGPMRVVGVSRENACRVGDGSGLQG